jgi:hypothetical protein
MQKFTIINEATEDTLAICETLSDAVAAAREVTKQLQVGELVSVLESGGLSVWQCTRLLDGTVREQSIGCPERG